MAWGGYKPTQEAVRVAELMEAARQEGAAPGVAWQGVAEEALVVGPVEGVLASVMVTGTEGAAVEADSEKEGSMEEG